MSLTVDPIRWLEGTSLRRLRSWWSNGTRRGRWMREQNVILIKIMTASLSNWHRRGRVDFACGCLLGPEIAEHPEPAGVAFALPWLLADPVFTSWIPDTSLASWSCPTNSTPAFIWFVAESSRLVAT